MAYTLILLRHGESTWNQENRFTGWTDVPLSETGIHEAQRAGQTLKSSGIVIDCAHTSVLTRAIQTLNLTLQELDAAYMPVSKSWRLNERHYGALQGLNKSETAAKHGEDQVKIWRRSFDISPPALAPDDPRSPIGDVRYQHLDAKLLPLTESLKTTIDRVLPYWNDAIVPDLRLGKTVLVAAHGNSLRALVKYLDNKSEAEILETNIPTAIPLLYRLDDALRPVESRYLGDQAAISAAQAAVANQGKAAK